jgi:spore maturation protein CgeB
MDAQMEIYGDNILDNMLTVDILEQLLTCVNFVQNDESFSNLGLVFSSTFLGFKLANLERVRLLNRLASRHAVDLYTDEPDTALTGVHCKGYVNYMNEMPLIFNRSRINLNMTIRNIRTGIPLRIWDILGAGGFLMTNYQSELPEYFVNGRDIVYFESHEDCARLCDYYLTHEDERHSIAMNGYNIVRGRHSYVERLSRIFGIVEKEQG